MRHRLSITVPLVAAVALAACGGSKAATVDTTVTPTTEAVATTAAPTTTEAPTTTAKATTSTAKATTTTAKATTTSAAAAAGTAVFGNLVDAFYPADTAGLLARLGFASWWPVPDEVETDTTKPPTILKIETRYDGIVKPGEVTRVTTYVTGEADTATAVDAWAAKLAGAVSVDTLKSNKNSGTENDVEFTRYRGGDRADQTTGEIQVTAARSTKAGEDQSVVVEIEQTVKGPFDSFLAPGVPAAVTDALPKVDGFAVAGSSVRISSSFGANGSFDVKLQGPRASWDALLAALGEFTTTVGAKKSDSEGFFASGGKLPGFDNINISAPKPIENGTLDPYVTISFGIPTR